MSHRKKGALLNGTLVFFCDTVTSPQHNGDMLTYTNSERGGVVQVMHIDKLSHTNARAHARTHTHTPTLVGLVVFFSCVVKYLVIINNIYVHTR